MTQVRRVRADEWQALRDLRLRALAGAPRAFSTTLADASARSEEQWRELATRGARGELWQTFVADEGRALVGMASGAIDDGAAYAELIQMWVEPSARRRGVGRRLVEAVLAWARERVDEVRLHVVVGEDGAIALYRSLGFRETGRRERVREDRADLEMEMVLHLRE